MDGKSKVAAVGVSVGSLVLVMHGASYPVPCVAAQYDCPEPEQRPADMLERGQQNAPTFYGAQAVVIGTATGTGPGGNTTITPGTGSMNFVSAAPQPYQDVQPVVWPSAQ